MKQFTTASTSTGTNNTMLLRAYIIVFFLLWAWTLIYTLDVSNWVLKRNPYDRIVHFCFGFLLAYPMRDYFLNKMQWPLWVCWVLPAEITLSFSGMYELIDCDPGITHDGKRQEACNQ